MKAGRVHVRGCLMFCGGKRRKMQKAMKRMRLMPDVCEDHRLVALQLGAAMEPIHIS